MNSPNSISIFDNTTASIGKHHKNSQADSKLGSRPLSGRGRESICHEGGPFRDGRPTRSTFDLFGIVKQIVDAKAQFRSLAEPWADTGTSTGRLMIAVLGGLAD